MSMQIRGKYQYIKINNQQEIKISGNNVNAPQ